MPVGHIISWKIEKNQRKFCLYLTACWWILPATVSVSHYFLCLTCSRSDESWMAFDGSISWFQEKVMLPFFKKRNLFISHIFWHVSYDVSFLGMAIFLQYLHFLPQTILLLLKKSVSILVFFFSDESLQKPRPILRCSFNIHDVFFSAIVANLKISLLFSLYDWLKPR